MSRQILVIMDDKRQFKITVPDQAKITFGPWSPPSPNRGFEGPGAKGTLRVYGKGKDDILGCWSGVESFRDLSLGYSKLVAVEEGAAVWKDDEKGYTRDEKIVAESRWITE